MKKNGKNGKNGKSLGGKDKTLLIIDSSQDIEVYEMKKGETIFEVVSERVKVVTPRVVIVAPYGTMKKNGAEAIRLLREYGSHVRVAFMPEEG